MPTAPIPDLDLRTPRLSLRAVAEADLPDLLAVNGDPQVTRFLPYETWLGLDDAAAWLQRMHSLADSGTARQLVIVQRGSQRAIGTVLLFRFDAGSRRLEIGYVLGRSSWGQGLMHEALAAVCGHLFTRGGLRRIEAEVNPANGASVRVLQALGFVHEGTLRQRWVAKGAAYDTQMHGLLAEDWLARRQPPADPVP